eukprot:TRINITY_DN22182_c0_g1_i1.p1 TRINITY_DN22182_c0_g1~~TRINITY_DN22182_c0_g1_i1.p1  ORF type:complete len:1092 (-),score=169.38 TRINITY_DN22182_c0_g1_i1:27-3302(-)
MREARSGQKREGEGVGREIKDGTRYGEGGKVGHAGEAASESSPGVEGLWTSQNFEDAMLQSVQGGGGLAMKDESSWGNKGLRPTVANSHLSVDGSSCVVQTSTAVSGPDEKATAVSGLAPSSGAPFAVLSQPPSWAGSRSNEWSRAKPGGVGPPLLPSPAQPPSTVRIPPGTFGSGASPAQPPCTFGSGAALLPNPAASMAPSHPGGVGGGAQSALLPLPQKSSPVPNQYVTAGMGSTAGMSPLLPSPPQPSCPVRQPSSSPIGATPGQPSCSLPANYSTSAVTGGSSGWVSLDCARSGTPWTGPWGQVAPSPDTASSGEGSASQSSSPLSVPGTPIRGTEEDKLIDRLQSLVDMEEAKGVASISSGGDVEVAAAQPSAFSEFSGVVPSHSNELGAAPFFSGSGDTIYKASSSSSSFHNIHPQSLPLSPLDQCPAPPSVGFLGSEGSEKDLPSGPSPSACCQSSSANAVDRTADNFSAIPPFINSPLPSTSPPMVHMPSSSWYANDGPSACPQGTFRELLMTQDSLTQNPWTGVTMPFVQQAWKPQSTDPRVNSNPHDAVPVKSPTSPAGLSHASDSIAHRPLSKAASLPTPISRPASAVRGFALSSMQDSPSLPNKPPPLSSYAKGDSSSSLNPLPMLDSSSPPELSFHFPTKEPLSPIKMPLPHSPTTSPATCHNVSGLSSGANHAELPDASELPKWEMWEATSPVQLAAIGQSPHDMWHSTKASTPLAGSLAGCAMNDPPSFSTMLSSSQSPRPITGLPDLHPSPTTPNGYSSRQSARQLFPPECAKSFFSSPAIPSPLSAFPKEPSPSRLPPSTSFFSTPPASSPMPSLPSLNSHSSLPSLPSLPPTLPPPFVPSPPQSTSPKSSNSWPNLPDSLFDFAKSPTKTVTDSILPPSEAPPSVARPSWIVPLPKPFLGGGESEAAEVDMDVPLEFVDCITQDIMRDPVFTADGHSYERCAIEAWLSHHDTSPMTGEVLPPPGPEGAGGKGVDKTLRSNHVLRGQIIEYGERLLQKAALPRTPTSSVKKVRSCPGEGASRLLPLGALDRSRMGRSSSSPARSSPSGGGNDDSTGQYTATNFGQFWSLSASG